MKRNHLSRFEDHIQKLVEGGFARIFAGRLHPRDVAVQLARVMQDAADSAGQEQPAPDVYIVRLHSTDHEIILGEQPGLADKLAQELVDMARLAGFKLVNYPEVRLLADDKIAPQQIAVSIQHVARPSEITQALPSNGFNPASTPPQAVLILEGERHIPLEQPIVNIGRHRDNHIIFSDPRVSRHHAQIRLRFGKYVLFDLDSRAGTTVNDQPVQETILRSGDVIKLAGVTVIYVEEDVTDDSFEESTRPYVPEPRDDTKF